ncbi:MULTISPECIES: hypothetical protein [Kocuria]|uniref:hypothetical protein n=1 Tax=Kocuria TaxID=57493 RepID=UPI0011A19F61|nr:hypothetical protein [Kocuria indica]
MSDWKAFVLMPFDPELDSVYSHLIEPALAENGFSVTRADLSINQQQILKDIVNQLASAHLVIVDVSGLNGNVMYELGLAHAMGKRTVMITQDISELPFDLKSYRANAYSTGFIEAPKLKERLAEIARGVVDGTAEFSNPVQDFAPNFLGQPNQVAMAPRHAPKDSSSGDEEPSDEEVEPGLLDYTLQLAESGDDLTKIAGIIAAATEEIGNKVTTRSDQLPQASATSGIKSMSLMRTMLRAMANDFDNYTNEISAQNPLFEKALDRIAESANGIARSRGAESEAERKQLKDDIESMRSAEAAFADAYDGVVSFSEGLLQVPSMEQTLTRAVKRAARTVDTTAELINLGRSELARARGLMEERLSSEG